MNGKILKEQQVASQNRSAVELSDDVKAIDAKLKKTPECADLWMERGLALSAMGLYREAVEAYSKAISLEPFCGIYYRHRAHRHLSCWEFEHARADFVLASRIIPDNWDVWYHLGLSNFLLGDYEKAYEAYKICYAMSKDEGKLIAISDWMYMTLKRLGKEEEVEKVLARITVGMDPGENIAYYERLLMYKGIKKFDELYEHTLKLEGLNKMTVLFGLGNYCGIVGDNDKKDMMFAELLKLAETEGYSAFGTLAALVDTGVIKNTQCLGKK